MKIYTRTGDDGTTGLIGARRVAKSDPRVEAYGAVDELNATLGVALTHDAERWFAGDLDAIQSQLFSIGAELAAENPKALEKLRRVSDADVAAIEHAIDRLDRELPELTRFIVPGGSPLAAELHRARTVCRRAERRVVALRHGEAVEPRLVAYLNRLADLLFVMARAANAKAGVRDREWGG